MKEIKQLLPKASALPSPALGYATMLASVADLLEQARRSSVRAVNTIMTATYWEIGRRIVDYEQGGEVRAEYGKALLRNLSIDLMARFGRGFSVDNLETMRLFYQTYPRAALLSADISETPSRKYPLATLPKDFHCRGRSTSCSSSGVNRLRPAPSTRPKPCAAVGVSASLTARFHPSSTNAPPFPATRRPC